MTARLREEKGDRCSVRYALAVLARVRLSKPEVTWRPLDDGSSPTALTARGGPLAACLSDSETASDRRLVAGVLRQPGPGEPDAPRCGCRASCRLIFKRDRRQHWRRPGHLRPDGEARRPAAPPYLCTYGARQAPRAGGDGSAPEGAWRRSAISGVGRSDRPEAVARSGG